MSDQSPHVAMNDAEEYISQKFTIEIKFKKLPPDFDGEIEEPKWSFTPEGEGITPSDVTIMCVRGIEWAVLGAEAAKQRARARREEQRIVPVGGGRGKVIRIN